MYDEAVQEEKRWATYLFQKGSMIGLSEKLLHQFVEYMANRRMRGIQLTAYDQKTNISWIDHWLNSKGTQNATRNRNRKLCNRWHKTRCTKRSI